MAEQIRNCGVIKNMEKIFFEYNENSITLYDAFKKADPPSDITEIFNKFHKRIYSYADFEIKHFKKCNLLQNTNN